MTEFKVGDEIKFDKCYFTTKKVFTEKIKLILENKIIFESGAEISKKFFKYIKLVSRNNNESAI